VILFVSRKSFPRLRSGVGGLCFGIAMTLLPGLRCACAQQADSNSGATSTNTGGTASAVIVPATNPKPGRDGEISVMLQIPDGDYRMFSATTRCSAWAVAVEYDRRWGHLLGARFDYVTEIIPVLLLSQPVVSDFWGNGIGPNQQTVPGISISPFGMRFLYREGKRLRPFFIGKLGAAAFTKKAFSPNASYVNFNVQAAAGVQYRVSQKFDLRVEPFQFFHVSNGYLAASNPGMDELAWRIGFTYHLSKKGW
jgi:Lipid A 3-O-deacylase (PagL)